MRRLPGPDLARIICRPDAEVQHSVSHSSISDSTHSVCTVLRMVDFSAGLVRSRDGRFVPTARVDRYSKMAYWNIPDDVLPKASQVDLADFDWVYRTNLLG